MILFSFFMFPSFHCDSFTSVLFLYSIPISSVFSSMLFQRIIMFKVMNAVRVDTGVVNKQEKRRLCHLRLCLCCSVPAIHSHHFHSSQHNEPETSKRGLRGRERERREGREGDQSVKKKRPRKKGWEKRQTPKYLFLWKCVALLQRDICCYSAWLAAERTSVSCHSV